MIGKIFISGYIGIGPDIKGIELTDVISQVKKQPNATSFEVYIDSEGGNYYTGLDIYNYLLSLDKETPVKTIGLGIVASMATIIFMAGSTREVREGCMFMIHSPMQTVVDANTAVLEDATKFIREAESSMIRLYTTHTKLTKEETLPLLRNETFLTGDQLETFGFTTVSQPLKIVAKLSITKHPKKMENTFEKEAKGFFAEMKAMFKKFGGTTTGKMLKTADQKDVDFADLAEDASPSVGDVATIDGEAPEAGMEYVMSDGATVVFDEKGAVQTYTPAEAEEEEEEEEEMSLEQALAQLDIKNAEVIDLTGKLNTVEAELTSTKKQLTTAKTQVEAFGKLKGKFESLQARMKPPKPTDDGTKVSAIRGFKERRRKARNA
jgi:ATP-dependent protease ClpP protease subunit